jgi:ATP-dependent Lon protease
MEVIELHSYTLLEKFNIAKKHLIPKQLKKHGLTASKVKISEPALSAVIEGYTKEAGVRILERKIASLFRKAAKEIVGSDEFNADELGLKGVKTIVRFDESNLEKYLGSKRYLAEQISKTDEVGVVNGLAWTSVGGVLMPLETLAMEGTGKIEVTGSLGDVMQESTKIAVSLVRKLCEKYSDFDSHKDFYKSKDLHIHAPEGAVPKNGPSAGITIVTSLVSTLTGIAVRRDVAMTGEVSLHGKVLAIGGLKEKSMAAYKAGIKTVIIPKENESAIAELDETVREALTFITVERIEEVLEKALVRSLAVHLPVISNPAPLVLDELKQAAENVIDGIGFPVDEMPPPKSKMPRRRTR